MSSSQSFPSAKYCLDANDIEYESNGYRPLLIGRGSFSDVYAATYAGKCVAVKELRVSKALPAAELAKFWDEVRIHHSLQHDNIVPIFGAIADVQPNMHIYALVLQRMTYSLHDVLYGTEHLPLSLWQRLKTIYQISCAMRYVHSRDIIHGDLKPGNVLVDDDGNARVSDFGEAKLRPLGDVTLSTHRRVRGTCLYMAPEILDGSGSLTSACDVYSFGIVANEILTNKVPYEMNELNSDLLLSKFVLDGGRPKLCSEGDEVVVTAMKQVITRCWDADAKKRPAMVEVEAIVLGAWKSVVRTDDAKSREELSAGVATLNTVRTSSVDDAVQRQKMFADRRARDFELRQIAEKAHQLISVCGSTINGTNKAGETPLYLASKRGNVEVVKWLLGQGADFNIANKADWTPLLAAANSGSKDIVLLLLNRGADVNKANNVHWTSLFAAAAYSSKEIVSLLLDRGANIHSIDKDGCTPLHVATRNAQLETVALLVDRGADVNVTNNFGQTCLYLPASYGNKEIVSLLLEHGASPTIKDKQYHTPLYAAADSGKKETLSLMLDYIADVSVTEINLGPLLCVAAKNGHMDTVIWLLNRGADVNYDHGSGATALFSAIERKQEDMITMLLDRGADVNVTYCGRTLLPRAQGIGLSDILIEMIRNRTVK